MPRKVLIMKIEWPDIKAIEMTDECHQYYVYVYLDPRKLGNSKYGDLCFDFEPFYVGKGGQYDIKGSKRWEHHIKEVIRNKQVSGNAHKFLKIRKILKEGAIPNILILKRFKNLEDVLNFEIEVIKIIGRGDLNKGPLTNKTDGGDGARALSEEQRKKISEKLKGNIPWNLYKTLSKELKSRIRMRLNKKRKEIGQYSLEGLFLKAYQSQRDAARITGLRRECIRDCCNNRQKSAYGYIWKYLSTEKN